MLNIQLPLLDYADPSVEDALRDIINKLNEAFPDGISETDLQNKDHWINQVKTHGIMCTTSDTNITVWASGPGNTDSWVNAGGTDVFVPV